MRSLSLFAFLLAVLLPFRPAAGAGETLPAPQTSADFEMIKALAGVWNGTTDAHGKKESARVAYKVTSAGTAVEETLFPGTPHEMVSVYFLDGKTLMMTHYCALGNQPRMKVTAFEPNKKIKFEMVDATGMKSPEDPHMGQLTVTMKDKDHLTQEWVHMMPGGKKESATFVYEREK